MRRAADGGRESGRQWGREGERGRERERVVEKKEKERSPAQRQLNAAIWPILQTFYSHTNPAAQAEIRPNWNTGMISRQGTALVRTHPQTLLPRFHYNAIQQYWPDFPMEALNDFL